MIQGTPPRNRLSNNPDALPSTEKKELEKVEERDLGKGEDIEREKKVSSVASKIFKSTMFCVGTVLLIAAVVCVVRRTSCYEIGSIYELVLRYFKSFGRTAQ